MSWSKSTLGNMQASTKALFKPGLLALNSIGVIIKRGELRSYASKYCWRSC